MRWSGHVARMADRRGAYRVLVGRPEGRRQLTSCSRGEDNIKMDLQAVGLGGIDWIDQTQDRVMWQALVNAVMNHRFPLKAGNFLTSWWSVSFSGRTPLTVVNLLVICFAFVLRTNSYYSSPKLIQQINLWRTSCLLWEGISVFNICCSKFVLQRVNLYFNILWLKLTIPYLVNNRRSITNLRLL